MVPRNLDGHHIPAVPKIPHWKKSTTIIEVCISIILLPQWFWIIQYFPCKEQWMKLVITIVETEAMTEVGASGVSSVCIWKYWRFGLHRRSTDQWFIFSSNRDNNIGSLGMGKYGGNCENLFEQSHCSAKFYGGFLPVGSKITDIDHRKRKAVLMACRLREKI